MVTQGTPPLAPVRRDAFCPSAVRHRWRSRRADNAASGGVRRPHTFPCMRINGAHIDQRRTLTPRDYASTPDGFGLDEALRFRTPAGGDVVSMRVAQTQHLMICAWQRRRGGPGTTMMRERFEISAAVWSRTVNGTRWAGETCLAAIAHTLLRAEPRIVRPGRESVSEQVDDVALSVIDAILDYGSYWMLANHVSDGCPEALDDPEQRRVIALAFASGLAAAGWQLTRDHKSPVDLIGHLNMLADGTGQVRVDRNGEDLHAGMAVTVIDEDQQVEMAVIEAAYSYGPDGAHVPVARFVPLIDGALPPAVSAPPSEFNLPDWLRSIGLRSGRIHARPTRLVTGATWYVATRSTIATVAEGDLSYRDLEAIAEMIPDGVVFATADTDTLASLTDAEDHSSHPRRSEQSRVPGSSPAAWSAKSNPSHLPAAPSAAASAAASTRADTSPRSQFPSR